MNSKSGKIQTVLGLIDKNELGVTLPHEHIFIDIRNYLVEAEEPTEKSLVHEKITLDNLWFARSNKNSSEDNLVFNDEDLAVQEVLYFKNAGGNTIIDLSCINIGRNPKGLKNVSEATGINIVMGTSYYIEQSYTPDMRMDSRNEDSIAQDFIGDITNGIDNIKAGIIGEIGLSWPLGKNEAKVLRAAGIASVETGCAINIHPGGHPDAPFTYINILEDVGVDLNRVAFSHMTRTFPISSRKNRARLAERGCYLEFDMFGADGIYPTQLAQGFSVANDAVRLDEFAELIEDGFIERILMSQDVCFKVMLRAYGGTGYSHILKLIVPKMLARGFTQEQINTIMQENPKRLLTFT